MNQAEGSIFEKIFVMRCAATNLWAKRNQSAVRWLPGGRTVSVKADLDFLVVRPDGKTACIDLKSFEGTHFSRGKLNEAQLRLSEQYAQHRVPSGMVVRLRALNQVYFYSIDVINKAARRGRFGQGNGLYLGPDMMFDPNGIFPD